MERNMIPLMVEINRLPSVCFSKALEFVREHVDILRVDRSLYGLFLVLCGTYLQISGYVWDQATNRVEVEPFTDMFLDHYDYSKETRSFSVPYPLWGMENVEEEISAPAKGPLVFNFVDKDGVAKVASFHPVGYGLERPPSVGDEFVCGYRMQIEFAFKR
ncbi:hypothetical protein SELMODRAFT_424837 [Selaginella moellendorffii]|uniref:Uncharacterized protein n=1 Tax=Selaginella moellendorffii TaxID=88036 RepID=D8SR63_SELML|nr:hypothetical protein SELMODRAFT_424837 [Selaginella moellendorffii]